VSERESLIDDGPRYEHHHACDGEIRHDCEACIEEWIRDIEAGGATRESAVATVDQAIQEGGKTRWMS
jgi:hypothetical protein